MSRGQEPARESGNRPAIEIDRASRAIWLRLGLAAMSAFVCVVLALAQEQFRQITGWNQSPPPLQPAGRVLGRIYTDQVTLLSCCARRIALIPVLVSCVRDHLPATAAFRSSCSKAEAMRSISALLTPKRAACLRHKATAFPASRAMARASAGLSSKYEATS